MTSNNTNEHWHGIFAGMCNIAMRAQDEHGWGDSFLNNFMSGNWIRDAECRESFEYFKDTMDKLARESSLRIGQSDARECFRAGINGYYRSRRLRNAMGDE